MLPSSPASGDGADRPPPPPADAPSGPPSGELAPGSGAESAGRRAVLGHADGTVATRAQHPGGTGSAGSGELPGVVGAAVLASLAGAAVAAYGLALPNALFGVHDYDDGVYFGAALRLTQGALPYRDFVFLHPPGIALLLAPLALLTHLVGTRDALGVARCLTVLVAGANCGLVALAVRHRGAVAALAGGMALACFPLAVTGDQTVLLEPYLAAACLLGTVLAFKDGELVTGRRALWAGVAFGAAGAIKVWAVLPILAVAVCCIGRGRAARRIAAGVAAGFALPCLPFFVLAPGTFVREVVVDQLRRSGGSSDYGVEHRLGDLTSLAGWANLHPSSRLVVGCSLGLGAVVLCSYAVLGRRARRADWFLLLAAALVVGAVLTAREFYEYYCYFPAVFVAATVGVSAGAWTELAERWLAPPAARARAAPPARVPALMVEPRRTALRAWLGPLGDVRIVAAVVVVIAAIAVVPTDIGASHTYVTASLPSNPAPVVDRYVPQGACVLTDESIVLITSNRFEASSPGCPTIVDSFGTWLSADPTALPPDPGEVVPSLAATWRTWFGRAHWVVLSVPMSDYIPWTASLTAWFEANYRLVAAGPKAFVYERRARPASVPAPVAGASTTPLPN